MALSICSPVGCPTATLNGALTPGDKGESCHLNTGSQALCHQNISS